jgi:hypothetical protein
MIEAFFTLVVFGAGLGATVLMVSTVIDRLEP